MRWFREWLDEVAPEGRPVVLVGFSGGAAFVGGLPVAPGQLTGISSFVAQGDADHVIPRELLDRTWLEVLISD